MKYQRYLELLAIGYLFFFLFISTVGLIAFPPSPVLAAFPNGTWFFVGLCLFSLFFITRLAFSKATNLWKRQVYLFCTNPIVLYMIPLGLYIGQQKASIFTILIYLLFEFSFFIISRSVWRTNV